MMTNFPNKWLKKYNESFKRGLTDITQFHIDFGSNDYLGFAKHSILKKIIKKNFDQLHFQGSTGSRLISGNRKFIEEIEHTIAEWHNAEAAIIYPSAYQANTGLFSSIADRNDLYLIDENVHASIYDGIRLSYAKHYKFKHNDFKHLKKLIDKYYSTYHTIYIVIEALYSMDGDSPDITELLKFIDNKKTFLIVDEAHSFGVFGEKHLGLFNDKSIAQHCTARIIGYGKAAGFSGSAIIGSNILKKYLINFSRSFIYTTALPLYHYQLIFYLYDEIINQSELYQKQLQQNINFFLKQTFSYTQYSKNPSPIQYIKINACNSSSIQEILYSNNIFAKVILPPTVAAGNERIRISLHAFNSESEILQLIQVLNSINNA
ncbi:MAG: 8-amino-7-oxononanoate synthase [Bacteroidia bacterium]|nr:MAG: 8-amino-7-oxononanoate synthase [Bacteroidia bacterium]